MNPQPEENQTQNINQSKNQGITPTSLKNQVTAKGVIQEYIDGGNITTYAEKHGLTRGAIYARLNKPEAQDIMLQEVRFYETRLYTEIEEMLNSPSPQDRRTALNELGKIVKHVQDKTYPSLFRTENINLNIDLTPYQQREQIHQETLRRLPPTHRTLYNQTKNQVTQEWNIE